jgi:hypothetical protein
MLSRSISRQEPRFKDTPAITGKQEGLPVGSHQAPSWTYLKSSIMESSARFFRDVVQEELPDYSWIYYIHADNSCGYILTRHEEEKTANR